MKLALTFLSLIALLVTGCRTDDDAATVALKQHQREADAMAIYAVAFNFSQTNWTMTITVR
jgi:hypothetical protein